MEKQTKTPTDKILENSQKSDVASSSEDDAPTDTTAQMTAPYSPTQLHNIIGFSSTASTPKKDRQ